jgi:hypothetical protein
MTRATAPAGELTELREKREFSDVEKDLPIPSIELLQGMALSDFRLSGLVVVVRCAVLGEEAVWAADNTVTARSGFDDKGRVIYHGDELRLLLALASHPEDLVAYHAMRKAVGWVEVDSIRVDPPANDEVTKETTKKEAAA